MSTQNANNGFSHDQIMYLRSPIWRGAVRQDPRVAKGNPYISGEYIIGQLNRAFGFDGWSVEILSMNEADVENINGKFKATYTCHIELSVYANGRILKRHGVGAHAMVSRNLVDVVGNGQASAYTKAIKSASITFGSQFGLNTVRGGRGWENNTQQQHPIPPQLGLAVTTRQQVESEALAETSSPTEMNGDLKSPQSAKPTEQGGYPLANLLKPQAEGGPTTSELRAVLKELGESEENRSQNKASLLKRVKSLVLSDTERCRKALDKVMQEGYADEN